MKKAVMEFTDSTTRDLGYSFEPATTSGEEQGRLMQAASQKAQEIIRNEGIDEGRVRGIFLVDA